MKYLISLILILASPIVYAETQMNITADEGENMEITDVEDFMEYYEGDGIEYSTHMNNSDLLYGLDMTYLMYIPIVLGIIGLIIYILTAYGLYKIGSGLKVENPWLAWMPIANLYLMTKIAGKSTGFFIGWFIISVFPFINLLSIIFYVIVMIEITKKVGYGVGMIILSIFFPFIAFPIMGSKANSGINASNTITYKPEDINLNL